MKCRFRLVALLFCAPLHAFAQCQPTTDSAAGADPDRLFGGGFEAPYTPDGSAGAGGNVVPGTHTTATSLAGSPIKYHVRVPPSAGAGNPMPMVVLLHGAAGTIAASDDFAHQLAEQYWANVGDANGAILVAPVGSQAQGGWRYADEARIGAVVAAVEQQYNVDRKRRYLWGFSAGGHFAHALALYDAQLFAAYATHAGVLAAYAGTEGPAAASYKPPYAGYVGTGDSLVTQARADRPRFNANGWSEPATFQYVEFSGGHTFYPAQLSAAWDFLCRFARP